MFRSAAPLLPYLRYSGGQPVACSLPVTRLQSAYGPQMLGADFFNKKLTLRKKIDPPKPMQYYKWNAYTARWRIASPPILAARVGQSGSRICRSYQGRSQKFVMGRYKGPFTHTLRCAVRVKTFFVSTSSLVLARYSQSARGILS